MYGRRRRWEVENKLMHGGKTRLCWLDKCSLFQLTYRFCGTGLGLTSPNVVGRGKMQLGKTCVDSLVDSISSFAYI